MKSSILTHLAPLPPKAVTNKKAIGIVQIFVLPFEVVLTFDSVYDTLKCSTAV